MKIMYKIRNFLRTHPSLRNNIRFLRWQAKKIPLLREVSMAVDILYFRAAGNERRTGQDYPEGDEYFESYARVLAPKARGKVIDIGCGHGFLTRRLAENTAVEKVIGLDKIDAFISRHPKIEYRTCNLTSEPLPAERVDTVVSSEFVEHISEEDFVALLRKITEILAPSGKFIGSTPRNPTPYNKFSGSRYHVREYNEQDLRTLLKKFFGQVNVSPVSEYCLVWEASDPIHAPLKLHLGCGEKYLEGYENVDYPPSEHSVMTVKADRYEDIGAMVRPPNSYAEIRSHHLFEHFNRAKALRLLLHWRQWLRPEGTLIIETPDFGWCADSYASAWTLRRRMQLGRHMLGSQEAGWANHYDFWDAAKFRFVLSEIGFKDIRIKRYRNSIAQRYEKIKYLNSLPGWLAVPLLNFFGDLVPDSWYAKHGGHKLPNILVTAQKSSRNIDEKAAVRKVLEMYLVGREGEAMLGVWIKDTEF